MNTEVLSSPSDMLIPGKNVVGKEKTAADVLFSSANLKYRYNTLLVPALRHLVYWRLKLCHSIAVSEVKL